MIISLILGLIVGAASVIFALQNIFPVTVVFLAWEVTASLAVLIALSILVGIILCALLSIPESISNALEISRLKKENKKLQENFIATHVVKSETPAGTPVETVVVEREV